jgi:hypothetical protein
MMSNMIQIVIPKFEGFLGKEFKAIKTPIYDLRHKARLVAGGNWTINDKEDIYSGVFRMDTVRMDFS